MLTKAPVAMNHNACHSVPDAQMMFCMLFSAYLNNDSCLIAFWMCCVEQLMYIREKIYFVLTIQ